MKMKAKYAAAHPGKLGDCIYTLPMMRYIYGQTGDTFDFYTSTFCAPLKELFEYQPYINKFIVSDTYRLERTDMGCQPAHIDVPNEYVHVYQMGFTKNPDQALHQYMAAEHGIKIGLGVRYHHPEMTDIMQRALDQTFGDTKYVCIAPRNPSSFQPLFDELSERVPSVIIGAQGEYTGHGVDLTGMSFLETCAILSRAKAFVGLMSSQLVLANGFDIPRIAPWDGKSWDMRHVINTHYNHYPVNPSVDSIINLIGL